MMKAILNWRYYVLSLVGFVAYVGIIAVPVDGLEFREWTMNLLISKAIGALAVYIFYKLVSYWEARNLIPELTEMVKEEEDDV